MPVIWFLVGRGCCNRAQTCHCGTVCVWVCPLHAAQGLATSRTVPQHPAGAPKGSELTAAPHVMDCYLCGREFDTRILNKHEDECIKHWRKWNNSLPLDQRQPEPKRPEFKFKKGHLYLLMYPCISGLCHRGICPYFCRFISLDGLPLPIRNYSPAFYPWP